MTPPKDHVPFTAGGQEGWPQAGNVCAGVFLLVLGFLIAFQVAVFVPTVVAAHLSCNAVSSSGSAVRMESRVVPR